VTLVFGAVAGSQGQGGLVGLRILGLCSQVVVKQSQ
jgi:hypothetical protein